jgi:hypothetical protein
VPKTQRSSPTGIRPNVPTASDLRFPRAKPRQRRAPTACPPADGTTAPRPIDAPHPARAIHGAELQLATRGGKSPSTAVGRRPRFSPRFRPYDLRDTAATLLLRAGVHPKAVSERLGHSSVAFTRTARACPTSKRRPPRSSRQCSEARMLSSVGKESAKFTPRPDDVRTRQLSNEPEG